MGRAAALQIAALLDVQLEIRVIRALGHAGVHDAIGIATDLPDAVRPPDAIPNLIEIRGLDVAGDDAAAGEATAKCNAFFVRPDDHLERMPRADSGGITRFDDAEGRQRTEIAVEIAAARHRVDVRSEQDGRLLWIAAGAPREDVARGIDARLESRRTHQLHDVLTPLNVGVGVGDAADTVGERAARRPSEHAELLETPAQRRPIHARCPPMHADRRERGDRCKGS